MIIDIFKYLKPKKEEDKLTKLPPREEYIFLKDYKEMAVKMGLNPDPNDPLHYYDYRGLWEETGKLELDEAGHFPSKWKLKGHPDMYVEGVKTKEEEKPGVEQRKKVIEGVSTAKKEIDYSKYIIPKGEAKAKGVGVKAKADVKLEEKKEEPDPFDTLNESIEKNYKQYQSIAKKLEAYEAEYNYAPDSIKPSIAANFNKLVGQNNDLLKQLQSDIGKRDQIITTINKDLFMKYKQLTGLPEEKGISATVPSATKYKPIIEGLPISKPEDKPFSIKDIKDIAINVFGTWEAKKKNNPELQKMEDFAYKVIHEAVPLAQSRYGEDYNKKGSAIEEVAVIYEHLTDTPKEETLKDIEGIKNRNVFFTVPPEKYKEAVKLYQQLSDIRIRVAEPGKDFIGQVGWTGMVALMGVQVANALYKGGMVIENRVIKGEKLKQAVKRIQEAYIKETGKFKSSLSNNDFRLADALGQVAGRYGAKMVGGLTSMQVPQEVFMGQAGNIANLVKMIQSAGKLTPDIANQLKVMNPVDTGLVFQQLSMVSPAIASKVASQFVELIPQKITKIPKAGEGMTPEELEQFEKLKEAKIIPPKKEIEPTKEELEAIEKVPTPKEKFMAKMEEAAKAKEISQEKLVIPGKEIEKPIIEPEKMEPEPTPEEIRSVFMDEGNLETTVKNREYFLGKFGRLFTETKKAEDTLIKQKYNEMQMMVEYEEDEIFKLAFGKEKMRVPETTKTEWMEGLGKNRYMQIFRKDVNLQYPDEIASNLGISENELREQIIERIRTAPREVTLESAKQSLIDERDTVFMQVTAQMDAYGILLDEIEGGEYSFDTPKNIKRLNAKISSLKSDSKKLMDKYEKEITDLQKEGIEKRFEELKKKTEAREKIGIEIGIKKGLKVAKEELKGKKLKGMTKEEIKEGNELIKQIKIMVKDRGFTKKQESDIKMTHGGARSLSGKTKRMTIPQLKAVLKAVESARPHRIGGKKVLSLKTEKKIQSLKDTLIEEMQMNEETYEKILKEEGIYKEPKYIDAKHFITEEKGKKLIYRLLNESNLLRITEPYRRAREAHPESKKIVDKLLKKMEMEGKQDLKDPHDFQSMRYIIGKMGIITGAPFYPVYRALIDINLENRADLHNFLEELHKFKEVIKDKKRLKVSESWILAKSNLEGKPEVPKDITEQEIELAKEVEGILKDYQSVARTEKFLDNIEQLEKMPQYKQYRKEMNKAKDIFESKGLDALKDYLKDQKWAIITSGYDPLQVISPKVRAHKSSPLTFGKRHIEVRTDIEYQEQDKDMIQRLVSYKKSMDNLSKLRPTLYAFFQLVDNNLSKFKDPDHVKDIVETFARELRGYNTPKNWFDKVFVRAYAQAMKTIVMVSPTLAIGRNLVLGQNLAIGHDKLLLIDPRNKVLNKERIEFIKTYVLQAEFMKFEWFESREKPISVKIGKLQIGLERITKMAEKVGLYPWSDTANRYWCFWGKINQGDRAFPNITPDSTEAEIEKAMWKAKFSDFREYEQVMALDILAKDGKEAMLRYLARTYTDDEHFIYQRAQRAPAEMGRVGRIWGNLMLWNRAYWEKLLFHGSKVIGKNIPFKERWRGLEVLSNIIIGGMLVGAAYKKITGRRTNPYNPLDLLAYTPGGLQIGTVEAVGDVYVNIILAVKGDKRALATLATDFPHAADMFIPFYDYALRAIEASTDTKNIDRLALRKIRMLLDKEYKVRGGAYVVNRNALERWQYFLSGAGIDVAIKEREKKEKEKGKFPAKIKFPEKSKFVKPKFPKRP